MKQRKKLLAGPLIAIGVVFISWLLQSTNLLDASQLTLTHGLYDEKDLSDEIVIVAIDEISMQDKEEGGLGSFDGWDRKMFGRVLENIEEGNPSAVMFDILFSQASDGLSSEEIYALVTEYPLAEDFSLEVLVYLETPHPADVAFADVLAEYDNDYLIKSVSGRGQLENGVIRYPLSYEPMDIFGKESNLAYANVSAVDESDNLAVIYAIPHTLSAGDVKEEHIDVQLAREHLGDSVNIEIPGDTGEMIINYYQQSFEFPYVSFSDVFYGTVSPSEFENKIVLIGATAASLKDRKFTPIDPNRTMPGIEIHANAIQTILDEAYLQRQDTGGFLGMVGVMAVVSVAAFLYLPVLAGIGVLVAELAGFPFFAQWRFDQGVIVELIWPIFAVFVAYLAVLAYRNFTEFKEKRKIKSAFGHYVSKELVEKISEDPSEVKLGGERRVMTTLFLDIENFTSLSENLEPAQVVSIINQYFDGLTQVIMANGGTVDKFEGDAIMALFGAPLASEDHGLKACRTALALRDKMAELNAATGQNLNIRVGIATGEAIVGNMGSQTRFDYTAMGDTVNTASRLESGNKFYGTRILVNQGAFETAQEHLIFRRIDKVRLKGKDEAISIYEIMGIREGTTPEGEKIISEWHSALEYYRNGKWDEVEARMRKILKNIPDDGPAKTYLKRLEWLRSNPPEGWDGTWTFEQK